MADLVPLLFSFRWEAEMFSPEVNSALLEKVRQHSTKKTREEPKSREQQQNRRKEKEAHSKNVSELGPITEKFDSLIVLGAHYLKEDGAAKDEAAAYPMNGEESMQE